jgi:hypothetical protein
MQNGFLDIDVPASGSIQLRPETKANWPSRLRREERKISNGHDARAPRSGKPHANKARKTIHALT